MINVRRFSIRQLYGNHVKIVVAGTLGASN